MSKNPKPGGRSDHVDFKVALRGTKPEDEVPELIAIAADANENLAAARIFDRVRNKVLQQAPQKVAIGANSHAGWNHAQFKTLVRRFGSKSGFDLLQDRVQPESFKGRL